MSGALKAGGRDGRVVLERGRGARRRGEIRWDEMRCRRWTMMTAAAAAAAPARLHRNQRLARVTG